MELETVCALTDSHRRQIKHGQCRDVKEEQQLYRESQKKEPKEKNHPKLKLSVVEEAAQEVCREWSAPGSTRLEPSPQRWFQAHFSIIQGCILQGDLNFSPSQAANKEEPGKGRMQELRRCSRCLGDISSPQIRSFYILLSSLFINSAEKTAARTAFPQKHLFTTLPELVGVILCTGGRSTPPL